MQASSRTLTASKGSRYWYFPVPISVCPIRCMSISPSVKAEGANEWVSSRKSVSATPASAATRPAPILPLFVGTRQQDREDVQHDDAARVDQQLHGSEKRVVELKIDAGRREQYEQQVCGRTQNPLGRDGQNREDEDHRGEKGETGLL